MHVTHSLKLSDPSSRYLIAQEKVFRNIAGMERITFMATHAALSSRLLAHKAMDKFSDYFMLSQPRWIYWGILLKILQQFIACAGQNSCYSPCCTSNPVAVGGSFTMGVALAGDLSLWYNSGATTSNLLSPCGTALGTALTGGMVAVFVPQVDQLGFFGFTNSSLLQLSETFGETVSLVVYSQGQTATIQSSPRSFMSPLVNLLSLTLVVEFTQGIVSAFIWKDDNCLGCGSGSTLCLNNNCGVSTDVCNLTVISYNNTCNFGLNVAFSGTDKNQKSLQSWYNIANTQKFSLSEIYSNISGSILNDINSIGYAVDGGS